MEYQFREIEKKWRDHWKASGIYRVTNDTSKPKCYVLDMFPYPSGTGLHVGHPLGYIASDIYSRYKRLKGFNVLHPMGFDSFGLPAEQYALDTGQHPAETTRKNIATFKAQLDNIGFSYDWDREVQTSDPDYYKWTQWIFLQLFNSFYNRNIERAEPISQLTESFAKEGNENHQMPAANFFPSTFTANEWKAFDEKQQQDILMQYRLAYCGYGEVNWCEALGTVLANDEVVNGVSERGGFPVVKKKLRQWYLRITEYADRLLDGLETVDFSDAMKEMQTNWIGRSIGAEIEFKVKSLPPLAPPEGEEYVPKYYTTDLKGYSRKKKFAIDNRHKPTYEENVLWELLRGHKTGFHIRRQHIIGPYIVDFVCLSKLTVIEVDGGYHESSEAQAYDKERTEYLKANGYQELRFSNEHVRVDPNGVVKSIIEHLNNAPSAPERMSNAPISSSGGEKEGVKHPSEDDSPILKVYTTRPDTIYGVDFMVIAPEHELVPQITTPEHQQAVEDYIAFVKSRSERERMAEKKITGVFTGAYAINPVSGHEVPIWISEYVLAGYGTGAIMAVPCGDERDHKFAKHFDIPITNIIGSYYDGVDANPTKEAKLQNSDFLNGMEMMKAAEVVVSQLELSGMGRRKINYKMRDAAFSRQRYWGEPFPIVWKNGIAYPLPEDQLPLRLPHVDSYKPGPEGEGPLSNLPEWTNRNLETNTMPGYAGSSWYFLRYMDPRNTNTFCDRAISDYWNQVDLYIGGTEHAVGHLLYSRMWTKVLYDLDLIGHDEPYKRLVNQGMIQGSSRFVDRLSWILEGTEEFDVQKLPSVFISRNLLDRSQHDAIAFIRIAKELDDIIKEVYGRKTDLVLAELKTNPIHVDVNLVDGVELNIEWLKEWRTEHKQARFILEDDGKYICGVEVEKMSKSKFNTVNPDELVKRYGADTFRMYEMFLGPVEMSKPWDMKGIEGVHRFLKKFWRLFIDENKGWRVVDDTPSSEELKALHNAIRKIENDTERFSFNTGVSGFMIVTNELTDLKCHKRAILEPLLILLAPYAPHIAEELWSKLGNKESILEAKYPVFEEKYVKESSKEYPVSVNGKTRTTIDIALDAGQPEVEQIVLNNEIIKKWLEGRPPKKIIFVKGKMVNVVV